MSNWRGSSFATLAGLREAAPPGEYREFVGNTESSIVRILEVTDVARSTRKPRWSQQVVLLIQTLVWHLRSEAAGYKVAASLQRKSTTLFSG